MWKLWEKIKNIWRRWRRWQNRSHWDTLSKMLVSRENREVIRLINKIREDAHAHIDNEFNRLLKDQESMEILRKTYSKRKVRKIFDNLAKRCRTLVVLQLKGNLDPYIPKHWEE